MLFITISIIGSIFIVLGFIGCFLPVLPGPPLSFIGLLMLAIVRHFSPPLTAILMTIMLIITIVVTGLDYVIPSLNAKRYKTSR